MAAISRGGLSTLYALQKSVKLQPGNLAPVIKRLQECGFLTRSEAAKRQRKVMKLTEPGETFLKEYWNQSLEFDRDFESSIRGVALALFMSDLEIAQDYSGRLASRREWEAAQTAPRMDAEGASPVEFYATMRAVHENRRVAMEAAVFKEIEKSMEEVVKNSKMKTR